jgi:hypothetical protein
LLHSGGTSEWPLSQLNIRSKILGDVVRAYYKQNLAAANGSATELANGAYLNRMTGLPEAGERSAPGAGRGAMPGTFSALNKMIVVK